jgi:hypothetical protein
MDVVEDIARYKNDEGYEFDGTIFDGKLRTFACLPPKAHNHLLWARSMPTVPRSEWKALVKDFRPYGVPILDQGQHNSCVGHGAVAGLMNSRAAAGQKFKLLSPCCLYGQINGGFDQGANISDAMTVLLKNGTCLESEVPEGMVYLRQFPADWKQSAANFRAEKCFAVRSLDEAISALIYGFFVVFGIGVGRAFGAHDAEGIATGGLNNSQNHCVYSRRFFWSNAKNEPILTITNSWGTRFGINGEIGARENQLSDDLEGFAIQCSTADPTDVDPNEPPPLV